MSRVLAAKPRLGRKLTRVALGFAVARFGPVLLSRLVTARQKGASR